MSTDSTELTFVRCPSCRSLVPAVSTRCRMCGATLEAGVKPEEEPKRSGRVRQRTMSQPQSELSATAQQIRDESEGEGEDLFDFGDESQDLLEEDELSGENPLGQYLDEDSHDADPLMGSSDDEDDIILPEEATTAKVSPADQPIISEPSPAAQSPVDQPRPKVVVESGARHQGRPSALSFGKGRSEERKAQPDAAPRNQPPAREMRQDNNGRQQQGGNQQQRGNQPRGDRGEDARSSRSQHEGPQSQVAQNEGRRDDRRQQPHGGAGRPQNVRQNEERQAEAKRGAPPVARPPVREEHEAKRIDRRDDRHESPPAVVPGNEGKLVGWLVSFDAPNGSAIELRDGKFFVTGTPLKETDLVLSNRNLSTPHAMISVAVGQGVRIQDLMSESGLFIRRKQKPNFQKEEGATTVYHGDAVRFGDAEFLVALIEFDKQ